MLNYTVMYKYHNKSEKGKVNIGVNGKSKILCKGHTNRSQNT